MCNHHLGLLFHVCCRPSNGRKMQALTAVEWLTAVRYETDGRLANGWTDGLPENRLTGLGAGLPLTASQRSGTSGRQRPIPTRIWTRADIWLDAPNKTKMIPRLLLPGLLDLSDLV